MHPLALRLLRRMRDPGTLLSRNRAHATFETPEGKAALRAHRLLRSLERDLCALAPDAAEAVSLRVDAGEVVISFDLPRMRLRRQARLETSTFSLLMESPQVSTLLLQIVARDAPELVPTPTGGPSPRSPPR